MPVLGPAFRMGEVQFKPFQVLGGIEPDLQPSRRDLRWCGVVVGFVKQAADFALVPGADELLQMSVGEAFLLNRGGSP